MLTIPYAQSSGFPRARGKFFGRREPTACQQKDLQGRWKIAQTLFKMRHFFDHSCVCVFRWIKEQLSERSL